MPVSTVSLIVIGLPVVSEVDIVALDGVEIEVIITVEFVWCIVVLSIIVSSSLPVILAADTMVVVRPSS